MGASANPDAEPAPLAEQHHISQFRSGVPGLDAWLQGKARPNEAKGGARTYVACDGTRVVGFCSLAASAVERWSGGACHPAPAGTCPSPCR